MKTLFFSAAIAASLVSTAAFAETAAEYAAKAKEVFAKRDYNNPGIQAAQEAADLYVKAAEASAGIEKAMYLNEAAGAIYFVGEASTTNNVKIEKHLKGIELADAALKILGIESVPALTDAQVQELKKGSKEAIAQIGEGLYYRGTHLGQWGQANGVVQSLSKWPELRRNMELIPAFGLVAIHDFGAFRVLGRGYYKIPGLLGGDMKKATSYLKAAFEKTKFGGEGFSVNGYNNIYYAEVLKENNQAAMAKEILQKFIAADPAKINADGVVELKQAQSQAKDVLKSL